MRWTIPLQVTVSIGTPTPVSGASPIVSPQMTSTPVGEPGVAAEGIFGGAAATVESSPFVDRFSKASLVRSKFGWKTALSLALASRAAYDPEPDVRTTVRQTWGLDTCTFIERDDTQCFVASSPDAVVVAFRGTESLTDWLSNLDTFRTTRSYGIVHRGFLGAFQTVDLPLRAELAKFPGRPVLLTGHSLGGALATIAAAEWLGDVDVRWVYTYGQPAVGKGTFPAFVDGKYGGKFFRFVNDDDIVPRVPPTYRHVGRLIHFDPTGAVRGGTTGLETESATIASVAAAVAGDGPETMSEREFDLLRAELLHRRATVEASVANVRAPSESLESATLASPALEGLFPSVRDHRLDRYLEKIAARIGS